jgi:malate synthase
MNKSLILNDDACKFLNTLHENFSSRITALLEARKEFYTAFDDGLLPDFSRSETSSEIREEDWQTAPVPLDIIERKVEITGPPIRKMVINALNSGANVFMADFEDSNSPTWENCINGQTNLYDAVRKTIGYTNPKTGKIYKLQDKTAVLFVRPRGLHLNEKNYLVDGDVIPACLFDFGLYFYNNYEVLLNNATAPYFYLPKLEHDSEAELWADIFKFSEEYVDIEPGQIRATVLIETIPAVFQMEEILYYLRDYSAGLNCGRWDYIFSFIKCFKNNKRFVLPDRNLVDMATHFMGTYSKLLIAICHKRGAHAMGGMSAQIPIKDDTVANAAVLEKVKQDKEREAQAGHDGTWVAHPGLVQLARDVFDAHIQGPNQIKRKITLNRVIMADDLLTVPFGEMSDEMLRTNIDILFEYVDAWIGGNGCVPLNNLMEDAATAEISRAQIWQWLHHEVVLSNRCVLNQAYFNQVFREQTQKFKKRSKYEVVTNLIKDLCISDTLDDFLTHKCYELIK